MYNIIKNNFRIGVYKKMSTVKNNKNETFDKFLQKFLKFSAYKKRELRKRIFFMNKKEKLELKRKLKNKRKKIFKKIQLANRYKRNIYNNKVNNSSTNINKNNSSYADILNENFSKSNLKNTENTNN